MKKQIKRTEGISLSEKIARTEDTIEKIQNRISRRRKIMEDIFLDKPSEIVPGKTVKGWMVDSVLKEYMNTENRDSETIEKLRRLSELAREKLSGQIFLL